MPRHGLIRKTALKLHLWLGLSVGLYLVMMGLTGSVLVFAEEIEPRLDADLLHVEPAGQPLPWQEVVGAFRHAHPDAPIARLLVPTEPDHACVFWVGPWSRQMRQVYVAPYTGEILGEQPLIGGVIGFVRYLHINLLVDGSGMLINGIVGLVVLVLLATGLYLWWPRQWRLLGRRLWVAWRAGWARVNWDLHFAVGAWSLPVLTLITLTGLTFPFYFVVQPAVKWALPVAPALKTELAQPIEGPPRPLEELVRSATAAVEEGRLFLLVGVDRAEGPLYAYIYEPGGQPWRRYATVTVDRATARVIDLKRQTLVGDVVIGSFYPLHTGRFGGIWTKSLYAAVGVTPGVLMVTGVTIWWRRRRPRKKRGSYPSKPADAAQPTSRVPVCGDASIDPAEAEYSVRGFQRGASGPGRCSMSRM